MTLRIEDPELINQVIESGYLRTEDDQSVFNFEKLLALEFNVSNDLSLEDFNEMFKEVKQILTNLETLVSNVKTNLNLSTDGREDGSLKKMLKLRKLLLGKFRKDIVEPFEDLKCYFANRESANPNSQSNVETIRDSDLDGTDEKLETVIENEAFCSFSRTDNQIQDEFQYDEMNQELNINPGCGDDHTDRRNHELSEENIIQKLEGNLLNKFTNLLPQMFEQCMNKYVQKLNLSVNNDTDGSSTQDLYNVQEKTHDESEIKSGTKFKTEKNMFRNNEKDFKHDNLLFKRNNKDLYEVGSSRTNNLLSSCSNNQSNFEKGYYLNDYEDLESSKNTTDSGDD